MTTTELELAPHPQRDLALEAALEKHGVTAWEFVESFPLDHINVQRSLANQARLDPLHQETVDRYAEDMRRGDVFPALLLHKEPLARGDRHTLIGGNHRTNAAISAERTHHAAYVVEADRLTVFHLMYEDNRRHGLQPSMSERLMAAMHLIDQGDSQQVAARTVGVTLAKLQRHLAAKDADGRAVKLRVAPGWDRLGETLRMRLGQVKVDRVFKAVADLAITARLTQPEISELVSLVNGIDVPDAAILAVNEQADAYRDRAIHGHTTEHTAKGKLIGALTTIRMLNASTVVSACDSADKRAVLEDQITAAAAVMQAIVRGLRESS